MSSDEPGPITRLFLRALQRVGSRWWAFRASRPPSPQARCDCEPRMFPNPGITVLNYKRQPVPGAQVYVDGKYVGTTSADQGKVGRIWPAEFTPCTPHLVTVIACDGSRATKTLGYWCYPGQGAATGQGASVQLGQGIVDNVIYVFTDKCGAAGGVAASPAPGGGGATGQPPSANPPQECHCDPTLNPNPGIVVINNQWKLVPGARVYVDGQYVGTTVDTLPVPGAIYPREFTPCQWHDVKVYACDGTCARAKLGYFCYPGNEYVYNVIEVNTDKCGGSMGWGDGAPEEALPCD